MGLDARVYCDCHEKGRIIEPPSNIKLVVESDGYIGHCGRDAPQGWDEWREEEWACEHPKGVLLHRRLGNIGLIALLRSELQREASLFPMLLTKVIYSGTHSGDFLAADEIPSLSKELEVLATFKCMKRKNQPFVAQFLTSMNELVAASVSVNKPIAF